MTELDAFILALDEEMKAGKRAEQALRIVVADRIEAIRERIGRDMDEAIQDQSEDAENGRHRRGWKSGG